MQAVLTDNGMEVKRIIVKEFPPYLEVPNPTEWEATPHERDYETIAQLTFKTDIYKRVAILHTGQTAIYVRVKYKT